MRILCFYLLFIVSNFHSQINEISSPNFGLRFEIKNFFLESTRFKIQEIKPYFEYNQNIKIGLGYCWLKNNKHHFKDSDSSLISIKSSNFFVSYNWGEKRLFYLLLVGIIFPVIVFIFFETILGLRFPPGIITNIYYN